MFPTSPGAGNLRREGDDFDLQNLMDDLAAALETGARAKGLELTSILCLLPPRLLAGDPCRLRQILSNLADNATKFTAKGEVAVCVSLVVDRPLDCRLRFQRTGHRYRYTAGQDRNSLRTIQPGGQIQHPQARRRRIDPCHLLQRLVEMMSGEIGVESQEGGGSTSWFTAPVDKAIEEPAGGQPRIALKSSVF